MSERTRNGKAPAQDALGFVFCLVGGFFAVSIVLFLQGQQPKPGLVSALTSPVVELVALLGPAAALLFSCGLAGLGTTLFLKSSYFVATRPLLTLVAGSLGVALIFGGFGAETALGAFLPGLVPGFVGRVLAIVLGVALAWLGWTLVAGERGSRSSSAELSPRVALTPRHDASGVSPAEAALLVSDPRATRPALRREPAVPLRDETIRPFTPAETARRTVRVEAVTPVRPVAEPSRPIEPVMAEAESGIGVASLSVATPPAPSWEGVPEEVQEEEEETAQRLSEALSDEFETEEASSEAEELEELEESEEEELAAEEAAPDLPRASWEQPGLFDEEEELEEEEEMDEPEKVELTASFDFEASEPKKPAHEPEPAAGAFVLVPAPRVQPQAAVSEAKDEVEDDVEVDVDVEDEVEEEPAAKAEPEAVVPVHAEHGTSAPSAPAPAPAPASAPAAPAVPAMKEVVLKPAPPPRPEPSVALVAEAEGWSKLVYDAGCAILEQKRVAVSMLERSFGIDFDQACRVLDELQQAGLIGPYMGGRTRDILLTREQWLPHAPHAT